MSTSGDAGSVGGGPPGWKQELEQRLALATPQDVVRGLFFNSMLELVRALGDEAAVERCLAASGERNFVNFFNYPISTLLRLTYAAGHELSARYDGFDGALRRMGQQAMADFLSSIMGRVLKQLAGPDVRTLMNTVQAIYRMTMSYGERRLVWEGPTQGRLILQRNFIPFAYHEGGLRSTLDRMGAQNVKLVGRQTGPLDSEYVFSWD